MTWISQSNEKSLTENDIWSSAKNYYNFLIKDTNNLESLIFLKPDLDIIFSKQKLKVLDLGCGTAWSSAYMCKHYFNFISEIHLVDLDQNFKHLSEDMFKIFNVSYRNVTFHNFDVNNNNFSEKFDVIILASSIHHIYNLDNLFSILHKIMNKDAHLIILNENPINHFKFSYYLLKNYIHDFYKNIFDPNYNIFKRISHCGIEYDPKLGDIYIPLRRYKYFFKKYNFDFKVIDTKLQQYKFMNLDHTLKNIICQKK